jgi:hypothetical protein
MGYNTNLFVGPFKNNFFFFRYFTKGFLDTQTYILSHVLVTKIGFGLVIGFINHLEVVTTIEYHSVPDLHTPNHSTLSLSCLQLIQRYCCFYTL